jgi:rfaE bifunctional protein kinase chain/domain
MNKKELKNIINQLQKVKIGVIGDFCLDAYWFIDKSKSEISVETGKKTLTVRQQKYSLGGAGNVANNLAAIGVKEINAFGVIGADPFGANMVSLMQNIGIKTTNILIQEEQWSTHVYTKPYIEDEEQSRIDFGNFNVLSEETTDLLISNISNEIDGLDTIIINQQVLSGIHTPDFRRKLLDVIRLRPDKIFIADSRNYCDEYNGAYRKMNDREVALLCHLKKDTSDVVLYTEIRESAKTLFKRYKKPLFVTRGERGSLAIDESGIIEIPGLLILSRIDTVGAGDSYLAGVASALAAGYGIEIAAEIGTFVAGVTVQKLFQTGTASPEEILKIGEDPDYIYRPELAEDIRHASYFEDSEIEIVSALPDQLNIKHAIFDHDGTISILREGWELIMTPMMIKAILGEHYFDADEALYHKVQLRVNDFIDKTTGVQTLVQMKGLIELIREFGLVPEDHMLDEFGYKQIYNNDLLKMVKEREKKLKKGELSIEDFTVKNIIMFIGKLHKAGIKLYLASGTDEEDVKNEASILGYSYLFDGGIFGAVGDVNKDAKKLVVDRILSSIEESTDGQIVTFGDGPVEMRETHKRRGISIGVASNELRRFGLNENKRTRLIKAGADIIIPDFSQFPILLKLLKIK